jgi:FkbM family methyltransferase
MPSFALMDTYGESPATTAKVLCNKLTYALVRGIAKAPQAGWLSSRWHWSRSPFSLRHQVLWSRPLRAWFCAEDETTIEAMLHMQTYEPVSWVAPEPGQVFLDVGAHVGWYTIRAAQAIGSSGRVIALEPDESNRRQLERNLSLNKITNQTVVPAAAWSHSGAVRWSPSEVSVWNQIDETQGSQLMQTVTIDELVSQLSLPRVDWIKMDIEGAETQALQGAEWVLRRFQPTLFIEIHETLEPVSRFLAGFGYSIEQSEFDVPPERHGWILARHRKEG